MCNLYTFFYRGFQSISGFMCTRCVSYVFIYRFLLLVFCCQCVRCTLSMFEFCGHFYLILSVLSMQFQCAVIDMASKFTIFVAFLLLLLERRFVVVGEEEKEPTATRWWFMFVFNLMNGKMKEKKTMMNTIIWQ